MKTDINLLTVNEVAEIFDVPRFTVREWAKNGDLPARKVGKRWFFDEKAIQDHFERKSI